MSGVGSHDAGWGLGWVAGLGYHPTSDKYFLSLLHSYISYISYNEITPVTIRQSETYIKHRMLEIEIGRTGGNNVMFLRSNNFFSRPDSLIVMVTSLKPEMTSGE